MKSENDIMGNHMKSFNINVVCEIKWCFIVWTRETQQKSTQEKNLHHFSWQETVPFQQQGLPINSLVCLTRIIQTPRAPKVENAWNLREFWDFWAVESACLLQVAKDCNQYLTALKLKNECTYACVYEWFHSVLTWRGANSSLPCKAERRFICADVYIIY